MKQITDAEGETWFEEVPICSKCEKNEAKEPHSCPYKCEIDDDFESECDCCDECCDDCSMAI